MKNLVSVNVRWLSLFVGFFGLWCLFRAAVCTYFLVNIDISAKSLKYLSSNTALFVNNSHNVLIFSTVVFSFVALISGVSAYGIFKHRNWARKMWVISFMLLFLYFLLASWFDVSSLPSYIPGFVLCIFSWHVLWYLPLKKKQSDSYNTVANSCE
jgi:hypothetical protein